jgi:hypothetical protein
LFAAHPLYPEPGTGSFFKLREEKAKQSFNPQCVFEWKIERVKELKGLRVLPDCDGGGS